MNQIGYYRFCCLRWNKCASRGRAATCFRYSSRMHWMVQFFRPVQSLILMSASWRCARLGTTLNGFDELYMRCTYYSMSCLLTFQSAWIASYRGMYWDICLFCKTCPKSIFYRFFQWGATFVVRKIK